MQSRMQGLRALWSVAAISSAGANVRINLQSLSEFIECDTFTAKLEDSKQKRANWISKSEKISTRAKIGLL